MNIAFPSLAFIKFVAAFIIPLMHFTSVICEFVDVDVRSIVVEWQEGLELRQN